MGMVVIQPCILVSKLKQTKTMFLRYICYLNSTKKPLKQDLLLILVLVRQQIINIINLMSYCYQKHVIKYCEKVYER